jgi:hypothetical protein
MCCNQAATQAAKGQDNLFHAKSAKIFKMAALTLAATYQDA